MPRIRLVPITHIGRKSAAPAGGIDGYAHGKAYLVKR
jgi:hypothetical protein